MLRMSRKRLAFGLYITVSDGQWREDWSIQLLWWRWDNVPYLFLETEHKPPGTNPVGEPLTKQLWRNPVDKVPR